MAVMPPPGTSAALIIGVASLLSQPDYQVRMILAGRLPKIISHYLDEPAAAATIRSLNELGLVAFVVSETDLRQPVAPALIAHTMKIEGDQAEFSGRDGRTKIMNQTDTFLLLTGRRTRKTQEPVAETTKMKLNVPATLLTGGLPIMKRVKAAGAEPVRVTEQFIRLYDHASDLPAVEIRQIDLDYSFLGNKMGPTATGNIIVTVTALRQLFSKANFNDSLLSGFVTEAHSISGIDLVEQNCLLIVRYYQALANKAA